MADSAISVGVVLLVLDMLRHPQAASDAPADARGLVGRRLRCSRGSSPCPRSSCSGRTIGPLTLHTYGVLLALAFLAGLWVADRQASKAGLDATRITDMAVYVLIGGLIGAKLLLLVVEWPFYSRNPRELFSLVQSGGVFYGGLIGALPVAWWYARRHGLPAWPTADVLAPGVAIGQAVGPAGLLRRRLLLRPADRRALGRHLPGHLRHPHGGHAAGRAPAPDAALRGGGHAADLRPLLWLARRKQFHGQVALAYIVLYAVARFVIEFYRGDAARGTVLGGWLSTSQFIAILMVLASCLLVYPYLNRKLRIGPAAA